jgi:hypothetical protein
MKPGKKASGKGKRGRKADRKSKHILRYILSRITTRHHAFAAVIRRAAIRPRCPQPA